MNYLNFMMHYISPIYHLLLTPNSIKTQNTQSNCEKKSNYKLIKIIIVKNQIDNQRIIKIQNRFLS